MPNPSIDPTTVACPNCDAPAGTPCRMSSPTITHHAARARQAELAVVDIGTCSLCGRVLLRGRNPLRVWHPPTVLADGPTCPPQPDTMPYDHDGWARFYDEHDGVGQPNPGAFALDENPDDHARDVLAAHLEATHRANSGITITLPDDLSSWDLPLDPSCGVMGGSADDFEPCTLPPGHLPQQPHSWSEAPA